MAVGYITVELGSGTMVAVDKGVGGVYTAVCVPKKEPTMVPTTEVIKTSGSSVGGCSPVQAVNMDAIRSMISMLVTFFFIRVSGMRTPFQTQRMQGYIGNSKVFLGINEEAQNHC